MTGASAVRRPGPWHARGGRGPVAGLLVLLLAACAGSAASDAAPEPSPSAAPTPTTRTSADLGYSVVVPSDWWRVEASMDWRMGAPLHRNAPSFDSYLAPDDAGDPWFVVGRMPVPPGTTLDAWISELRSTDTITYPYLCDPPVSEEDATLGGEPARLVELRCPRVDYPKQVAIELIALHEGSGYVVLCSSHEVLDADMAALREHCAGWLDTWRFVP